MKKYTDICISDYSQQETAQDPCMSTLVRPRLFGLTSLRFSKESYGSCVLNYTISFFKYMKPSAKFYFPMSSFKYRRRSFRKKVHRLAEVAHEEDFEYLSSSCLGDKNKIFRISYTERAL